MPPSRHWNIGPSNKRHQKAAGASHLLRPLRPKQSQRDAASGRQQENAWQHDHFDEITEHQQVPRWCASRQTAKTRRTTRDLPAHRSTGLRCPNIYVRTVAGSNLWARRSTLSKQRCRPQCEKYSLARMSQVMARNAVTDQLVLQVASGKGAPKTNLEESCILESIGLSVRTQTPVTMTGSMCSQCPLRSRPPYGCRKISSSSAFPVNTKRRISSRVERTSYHCRREDSRRPRCARVAHVGVSGDWLDVGGLLHWVEQSAAGLLRESDSAIESPVQDEKIGGGGLRYEPSDEGERVGPSATASSSAESSAISFLCPPWKCPPRVIRLDQMIWIVRPSASVPFRGC